MTSGTTLRWLPVSHSKHLVQCDPAAGSDEQPEGLDVFEKLPYSSLEGSSNQTGIERARRWFGIKRA